MSSRRRPQTADASVRVAITEAEHLLATSLRRMRLVTQAATEAKEEAVLRAQVSIFRLRYW
jgi:hypothetical protein